MTWAGRSREGGSPYGIAARSLLHDLRLVRQDLDLVGQDLLLVLEDLPLIGHDLVSVHVLVSFRDPDAIRGRRRTRVLHRQRPRRSSRRVKSCALLSARSLVSSRPPSPPASTFLFPFFGSPPMLLICG